MKGAFRIMKKILKRLCTGVLAFATVVTALPSTAVHAESKQYWTESEERVGIVEKVMNDGSIGSTFNEVVLCQYFGHKKSNFFMLHF